MEIRSFDSFEEAQQAMADGIEWGNANLAPAQKNLTYGSTFVEFVPELLADRIVIFGRVETLEEVRAAAEKYDAPQAEIDSEVAMTERAHDEGMLFSRCYSVVTEQQGPSDGELGSKHRINLWPIPETLFEAARQVGWNIDALPRHNRAGLTTIYDLWRTHALAVAQADAQEGGQ